MININWVTLRVRDMDRSKLFYGDMLGMIKEKEFNMPEMTVCFYRTDSNVQIELIEGKNDPDVRKGEGCSIGIAFDKYDEILETAKRKGVLKGEPVPLGDSLECFFIEDPDGYSIQVIKRQ